jgi:hypothetical protein
METNEGDWIALGFDGQVTDTVKKSQMKMNRCGILRRFDRAETLGSFLLVLILFLAALLAGCNQNEMPGVNAADIVVSEGAAIDSTPSGAPASSTNLKSEPAPPSTGAAYANNPASANPVPAVPPPNPGSTAVSRIKSAAAVPPDAGPPPPGAAGAEFQPVTFAYLSSFQYDVPDAFKLKTMKEDEIKKLSDQIPEYIKNLNTKKVALHGFMVPIDVEGEGIKSFILTNSRMMCCFGQMPWYNEWVYVEMEEGHKAKFTNDIPVTVCGDIQVGEEIEDGFVISLYRMKSRQVTADPGVTPQPAY